MTTIVYPHDRPPRNVTVELTGVSGSEIGEQVGHAIRAVRERSAPARPIVPRPLWEAHRLFQEPKFPDGLDVLEGDEDEGPGGE